MDDAELRAQLERHHCASFGWALACCRHDAKEAENTLQTAYLKILEKKAVFHGRATFKTWLFAVIRRTASESRRLSLFRSLGLVRYWRAGMQRERVEDPAEVTHRSEIQSLFRQAFAGLPQRQREVLHLVFYQDLSIAEAAGVLGISLGTARVHYERGKRQLRDRMEATRH
jgi:RNA polymerase sigma-70 factor (ECF subfamily)